MTSSNPLIRAAEIQTRLVALNNRQQPINVEVFLQTRPMAYKDYTDKAAGTHVDAEEFCTFSAWMNRPLRGATIILGLFHTPVGPKGLTSGHHETWAGALVKLGKKGRHLFLWDCNTEKTSGLPNFVVRSATRGQSELGEYLNGKFDLRTIWVGGKALGNNDTPFELTMQWLDEILTSGGNGPGWDSFDCVWEK
ncbi:hypothetical protein MMC11_001509 [Xylographa trunciseda]|nr:hypothetical protein [Xylographa trunciseda]